MKSLRPERARKFAAKFVANGFNPIQAVIDCGITQNRNSAHVIGYRLLRNVTAQNTIRKHLMDTKMSADEVLERLTKVARTDADFKGSDVVKAAELLGKGHKLFTDKVETSGTTERDAASSAFASAIQSAALADNIPESQAASELYERLRKSGVIVPTAEMFGPYWADVLAGQEQPIEGGEQ